MARSALKQPRSSRSKKPLLIGLTGGPGAGKSTVAKLMKAARAKMIDADAIGHSLLAHNRAVIKNTEKLFGNAVLGKKGLDRKLIGDIVFGDDSARRAFNRIIHPPLLRQLKKELTQSAAEKSTGTVVVDAALIFEWGIADWFDLIIVVAASRAGRIARLREAGLSMMQARKRFAAQLDQKDKVALADYVIKNDGNHAALEKEVRKLMAQIAKISR